MNNSIIPTGGGQLEAGRKGKLVERPNITVAEYIKDLGPFPPEGLFLGGIVDDGLPLLLNMTDPVPGPILIRGDQGAGKQEMLLAIAKGARLTNPRSPIQWAAITPNSEWIDIAKESQENTGGIFHPQRNNASALLKSLAEWGKGNNRPNPVVLFFEGLETARDLPGNGLQDLRWLLLRGPQRRIWPIVTLDTGKDDKGLSAAFHTVIYGRTKTDPKYNDLDSGRFTMREGKENIKFWVPHLG